MDKLPKVLQNEIWEYVRGGRAYWKLQFWAIVNGQMTEVLKFIARASEERHRANRAVTCVIDTVPELVAPPVIPLPPQGSVIFDLFMEQIDNDQ